MMEASRKGNCMFVSKNTFKFSSPLILLSSLLCVSYSHAQQAQDSTESRRIERLGESGAEEWEMDLRLPSAAPAASQGATGIALPDEQKNKELQQLLSKLAANPGDKGVLAQLDGLLSEVLDQINGLMDAGAIDKVEPLFALIQAIDPGLAGFSAAKKRLEILEETNKLLKAGEDALVSGRVLEPANDNAFYFYSQALAKNPQSEPAREGLEKVQRKLIDQALEFARELDFETAEAWLVEASAVSANQKPVEDARLEVSEFKQQRATELQRNVIDAMHSGNFELADFGIIDLMALGGHENEVKSLLARLKEARIYGGFEPGQVISDELKSGGKAPEIVIIDAGSFLMGSQGRSDNGNDHEEPQHRVVIKRGFGLGVTEVTVAQFRVFIKRTGYRTAAELSGSSNIYDEVAGRLSRREGITWKFDYQGKPADPQLPVLHVNANDAQAYLQWLSVETGKAYRLPSEAEYEYVARAGGSNTYWWGEDSPDEAVENLTGERDRSPSKREWTTSFKRYGDGHWGPAPVGAIVSNDLVHPMGVRDIAGNVSEWMADCWHDNYVKAPSDGSAWFNPGCERRVVRGGYWASAPEQSRAAFRFPVKAESYGPVVGFRVARDL